MKSAMATEVGRRERIRQRPRGNGTHHRKIAGHGPSKKTPLCAQRRNGLLASTRERRKSAGRDEDCDT